MTGLDRLQGINRFLDQPADNPRHHGYNEYSHAGIRYRIQNPDVMPHSAINSPCVLCDPAWPTAEVSDTNPRNPDRPAALPGGPANDRSFPAMNSVPAKTVRCHWYAISHQFFPIRGNRAPHTLAMLTLDSGFLASSSPHGQRYCVLSLKYLL